jgi:hypothetical protein
MAERRGKRVGKKVDHGLFDLKLIWGMHLTHVATTCSVGA